MAFIHSNRKIFLASHFLVDKKPPICEGAAKFCLTPDLFTPCPKTVAIAARAQPRLVCTTLSQCTALFLFMFYFFLNRWYVGTWWLMIIPWNQKLSRRHRWGDNLGRPGPEKTWIMSPVKQIAEIAFQLKLGQQILDKGWPHLKVYLAPVIVLQVVSRCHNVVNCHFCLEMIRCF